MPHPASGDDAHAPPRQLHPPAKVDLLHVGEEAGVETAHAAEYLRTAAEGCTAHPKDIAGVVVLPPILLQRPQDTSPTERETEPVDESARSTRILEPVALGAGEQFRPHDSHVGLRVELRDQRLQPPLRRFDIGVEQHPVIAPQPLQRAVVTSGETVVFRQPEQRNRRKLPLDERRRPVGRTVVRHDDLHPRRSGAHHRGKEAPQMGGSVPVEYDDLYDGHCGRRCFQRRCDQSHISGSATMSLSSCRT